MYLIPVRLFSFTVASSDANMCPNKEEKRTAVCEWLIEWIQMIRMSVCRPAVVFDVDSTLIERNGENELEKIDSVYRVLRKCQEWDIACYIVTARLDFKEGRRELRNILKSFNMKKIARTFMRPSHVHAKPRGISAFKHECRRTIEKEENVTIIANIGDNWHDILLYPYEGELKKLSKMQTSESYIVFPTGSKYVGVKLPA